MNMKNATILLIFLLSVLGLIIGVYYTTEITDDNSHESEWNITYEESDGVLTLTLEKKEKENDLSRFFT